MPEKAENEEHLRAWARQLERDRLRHVKTQEEPWLPGPGAAAAADMGELATPAASDDSDTQTDWGRQLERQRMQLQMINNNEPWLPGPGAAKTAEIGGFASIRLKGSRSFAESGKKSIDKLEIAKKEFRQHGLIGVFFAFFPQAKGVSEQATKPLLSQLWGWHWGFLGAIKTSPISFLLTGPAVTLWAYLAHMKGTPGLCKFGIKDWGQLIGWYLIVGVICAIIALYYIVIIFIIMCLLDVVHCINEFSSVIRPLMR
jgi:hypothetical protein